MYIRTKDKILDMENTNKCIYVIRDTSKETENRYVSYLWDNWKEYYLIDYQSCMLFSYNSAQSFISDLIKENLNYQNLVIELSPYYKDCKQADTIEELCDEFIHKENTKLPHIFVPRGHWTYEECKEWCFNEYSSKNDYELYGAIWTDKGLIYVAKMNNRGDLLLL